ncbi:MAG: PQQ-dependent sugar dehydrogenase [Bryobacter sp.]|nr:PQQ-dependent sugar dehydrogenase [Bryobacter sp.]
MLELPTGVVLVSDAVAKGSVIALSNNGATRKALITDLDRPFGLALYENYLYVSEAEAIKRYRLDAADLTVGDAETVVSLKGYNKGHWTRSIAFDTKAKRMYVSVGSGSNVDPGDPKDRAAINVYNPDGTNPEIFATGLRNPVAIHFHPATKKLWATVQERDGLGDDLVPDFFTEVKRGAFYGWPYAYIGPNEEPRNAGKAPELVKQTVVPDVVLPAHVAAMDFAFYSGKQFPAKYRNGAFVAWRGSGNRSSRVGYSVAFVPFKKGQPAGAPEPFLSGWMTDPGQREVWGRPVGVLELKDGSLLVSEDGNNEIWQVRYTGK